MKSKITDPLILDFNAHCLDQNKSFYAFLALNIVRKKMFKDQTEIEVNDFGAGSKRNNEKIRRVNQIAKSALKAEKFGQLMFRIAEHYSSSRILELGTSLGLTTGYLAKGNKSGEVFTLEGCPNIAKVSKQYMRLMKLDNVKQGVGEFDESLPKVLNGEFDLVFFDGNHQEEATKRYFETLLNHKKGSSIFVFDDIYWSKGMRNAWEYIKGHESVVASLDLFELGIVFFDPNMEKKDYVFNY